MWRIFKDLTDSQNFQNGIQNGAQGRVPEDPLID